MLLSTGGIYDQQKQLPHSNVIRSFSHPKSLLIDLIGGLLTSPNMGLQLEKTRVNSNEEVSLETVPSCEMCTYMTLAIRTTVVPIMPLICTTGIFSFVLSLPSWFLARLHEVQKSYCSHHGRTRSRSRVRSRSRSTLC